MSAALSPSSSFLIPSVSPHSSVSPVCCSFLIPACSLSALKTSAWGNCFPHVFRQGRCRSDREHKVHQVIGRQVTESPPVTAESPEEKSLYDCVIVGAGICGLSTALALATRHGSVVRNVLVTEARDRVGGNITTVERGGYLWEEGPNSFQPNDPILTMVVDIGLKDELLLGDPNAPRFVLWEGKLKPVPAGPADLPFFDLMSIPGKLRAGLGALGLRPPPPGYEESVEEFVRRNLGAEVFERLIEPFCSGVYAGDPSKLSMKAAFGRVWRLEETGGSIIGGTFKLIQDRRRNPPSPRDERLPKPKGQTVGSFRKGLITLPVAIAEKLGDRVKLNWKLQSVQKNSREYYDLIYVTPEGLKKITTKTVVLTVPSYVASDILRPLSQVAAESLSKFYYPPVAAVTLSYPKSSVRADRISDGELKGFGQLHPRSQHVETLGTIYSSSLFPGRAPDDRVLLLNYIGGATNSEITMMGEDNLVSCVDKDLRTMLIKTSAPFPEVLGVKIWPRAIPQFLVGHLDILNDARKALQNAGLEGLFLGGNYVVGVALGRCVEGSYETADAISKYFSKSFISHSIS
eukprot:c24977_g1_i1 orf=242-1966(+)